MRGPI